MFAALVLCCALSAVARAQVQTINFDSETIAADVEFLNIDALEWKGTVVDVKCRVWQLPVPSAFNASDVASADGAEMRIYNHHKAISYLLHPNPSGSLTPGGIGGSAEFTWIRIAEHGASVKLVWLGYNHGWTVVEQTEHVELLSRRPSPPAQAYIMLTARNVYEDAITCAANGNDLPPGAIGANVPKGLTEFLGTFDTDPRSVEFGEIIHLSPGKPRGRKEYSGEHHHGGISKIDGELYVEAPSLSIRNRYLDRYSLRSKRAPVLASFVDEASLDAIELGSLHTAHMYHDDGNLLVSTLGDSTPCVASPGGIVEISSNAADAGVGFDFDVRQFWNFADDAAAQAANVGVYPPAQVVGDEIVQRVASPVYAQNTGESQFALINETAGETAYNSGAQDVYTYDFTINECGTPIGGSSSIMVSSAWAPTTSFDDQFKPFGAVYGNHVRVHRMRRHGQTTTTQLGAPELELLYAAETRSAFQFGMGVVPLEVRRKHEPCLDEYLVGVTLPGALMRVWNADKAVDDWRHEPAVNPFNVMAHAAGFGRFSAGAYFGDALPFAEPFTNTTLNTCVADEHEIDNAPVSIWTDVRSGVNALPNIPILQVGQSALLDALGGGTSPFFNLNINPANGTFNYASVPLITDITIDLSDNYVYASCWLAGTLLQYDISDMANVRIVGAMHGLGGISDVAKGATFQHSYNANSYVIEANYKGTGVPLTYAGGPQMLRVEPSGEVIYVSNSLFSTWDDQFFPPLAPPRANDGSIKSNGGMVIRINTGVRNGCKRAPMSIDTRFGNNGVLVFDDLTHPSVDGAFKMRAHEVHIEGIHR